MLHGMLPVFLLAWSVQAEAQSMNQPNRYPTLEPPQVGEHFPLYSFPQLGASELGSLADYRGQKVLLIQFASW